MNFRILYGDNGQLCNRFWSYLGHIIWALKNDKKIFILTWNPNVFDYPNLLNSPYVRFSFRYIPFFGFTLRGKKPFSSILQRLLYSAWFTRLITRLAIKHPENFYREWPPSYENFTTDDVKFKPSLRLLFRPKETIVKPVDSLFQKYREEGCFMIGVHVRRGDYGIFKDGIFFYSFERYAQWMEQVLTIYSDHKVCFYMASVEPIPTFILSRFNTCMIPGASASADIYALSLCDRIFGPPSSFSRLASFLNDVPLCLLTSKESEINEDADFSPIWDHERFLDGEYLPVDIAKMEV